MGARGPQPLPDNVKHFRGTAKRPVNLADGINPTVEVPDVPKHLCAEAKKEWKRVSVELLELGLISKIDRAALALYCQAWGHLVMLEQSLNASMSAELIRAAAVGDQPDPARAFYFTTDKGYQAQTVTVQMINTLRGQVHQYLKAFGMDPSSRSRVTASTAQLGLPGMEQTSPWAKHKQG